MRHALRLLQFFEQQFVESHKFVFFQQQFALLDRSSFEQFDEQRFASILVQQFVQFVLVQQQFVQ